MDFRDTLSAELPGPRDDEPGGLRQDILDELADHLACSYNRELLRGEDPGEARRCAIERFGNPAAVARRLWFDAMRGKIMAQRVLIATCLIVVVACFGIVGLVWSQSNRSAAEAAAANRRLAELLAQSQVTNQEMLRQLQAMANAARPNADAWIPVKFKLTLERPDGPPAVGYEVILTPGAGVSPNGGSLNRHPDAAGLVDCGVIRPGDWRILIGGDGWNAEGQLNAVPGVPIVRTFVCPSTAPSRVRVRVDWPEHLAGQSLHAVALFRPRGPNLPDLRWKTTYTRQIFCDSRGPFIISDDDLRWETDSFDKDRNDRDGCRDDLIVQGLIHGRLRSDLSISDKSPLEVWAGHYSLDRLMLFRARPSKEPDEKRSFELLALMNRDTEVVMVYPSKYDPAHAYGILCGFRPDPSSLDQFDHFESRPGQTTEWVISPPEELIKAVKKRLKADTPTTRAG